MEREKIISALKDLEQRKSDFVLNNYEFQLFDDGEISFDSGMIGNFAIMSENAKKQLSERINFPYSFYEYLENSDLSYLLSININNLKDLNKERFLFRCLNDGEKITEIRAILSDRYKIINNYDAFILVDEVLKGFTYEVKECFFDENELNISLVFPHIKQELNGEEINAGLVIVNNEIGSGSFSVFPRPIFKSNNAPLVTHAKEFRRVHLGEKLSDGEILEKTDISKIKTELEESFAEFLDHDFLTNIITQINELKSKRNDFIDNTEKVLKSLKIEVDEKMKILNNFDWSADAQYLYFRILKEIKDLEVQKNVYKVILKTFK